MAALVRWVLARFCWMAVVAAVLCPAPKAAGVASLRVSPPVSRAAESPKPKSGSLAPAPPNIAYEVRQVSILLRSGVMTATVNWTVDDETNGDVLRGHIEYRPDSRQRRSCSSIRFIQVAKTQQNGGADYDWQGSEERRNLLRTSRKLGAGIEDGYFVDHQAFGCAPTGPCSPYFRDHWANPRESGDGSQRGGRSAPASLVDYPFGWETMEQISLESCARCAESGEFLGCAEWGARWPAQGRREIVPIRVRETPSKTFLAALRRFEEFYTPRSAHKIVSPTLPPSLEPAHKLRPRRLSLEPIRLLGSEVLRSFSSHWRLNHPALQSFHLGFMLSIRAIFCLIQPLMSFSG